jgi:hypothetical protein
MMSLILMNDESGQSGNIFPPLENFLIFQKSPSQVYMLSDIPCEINGFDKSYFFKVKGVFHRVDN